MKLTIHRGTHQIGGCATEISTADTRIFIDFGSELPGPDEETREETLSIPGLTVGAPDCDGVFFTHTHGDHIGNIHRILPEVPLYMGAASREIGKVLNEELARHCDRSAELAAIERARIFSPGEAIQIGDVKITPLRVDHSAFDAYMFLVEADGVRLLHTGDFRDHGYTGRKLAGVLEKYAGQVDWLVTEGTMLSRDGEGVMTEQELEKKARRIMAENERVFVLCSSTNIDRIRAFYRAKPKSRPAVCDRYQKKVLNTVEANAPGWLKGYDFRYVIPNTRMNHLLHDWMEEQGFLMFVRVNRYFREFMRPYQWNCKVIYSMWRGYLEGPCRDSRLADFLAGYDVEYLHTSGHATRNALRKVYELVQPRQGVIPMHSEAPEQFKDLVPENRLVFLQDGQALKL